MFQRKKSGLSRRRRSSTQDRSFTKSSFARRLRAEQLEERCLLTTFTVLNANDSGPDSLREAILTANGVPGPDTILFDPSLAGQVISLSGTELEVTEELTIDASALAQPVTIDAQNASRVLNFSSATGDLTLNSLVVTQGNATAYGPAGNGGGLYFGSLGTLTLNSTTISSSSGTFGGGLATLDGDVVLNNSNLDDNESIGAGGGAFVLSGNVTLTSSSVTGNESTNDTGGGIFAGGGAVTISGSTLSGNDSPLNGGGIFSDGSPLAIFNSTISGNTTGFSGGGIFANYISSTFTASVVIENSTITENTATGAGIGNGYYGGIGLQSGQTQMVTITNSIVSGNTDSGIAPDFIAPSDPAINLIVSYSLIGDNRGTNLNESQTPSAAGNLVGDVNGFGLIDPLLDPLTNNGGLTETHALQPGSPALDAGDPGFFSPFGLDQRGTGFARVQLGIVDIGAFEEQMAPPPQGLVVSTIDDELDGDFSIGDLSLREAIDLANMIGGVDTITFDPSLAGQIIQLDSNLGELEINGNVGGAIIEASALPGGIILDADFNSRVLSFQTAFGAPPADLELINLSLFGGRTSAPNEGGGAIEFLAEGTLTLVDSLISGNETAGTDSPGGAIYSTNGAVTLINSEISQNATSQANSSGGGVFTSAGAIAVIDSTISYNQVFGDDSSGAPWVIRLPLPLVPGRAIRFTTIGIFPRP